MAKLSAIVQPKSSATLPKNRARLFPIIAVGGIHSAEDALEKLAAGADLLQVYTGFVYEGSGLVKRINKGILARK